MADEKKIDLRRLEVDDEQAVYMAERIYAARREHLVAVDQPLVMVSQLPRSGGTLLMRMFDGHTQCHAVPHEITLPWTKGDIALLTGSVDAAWEYLKNENLPRYFERGFRQSKANLSRTRRSYPFILPPVLQERLFRVAWERQETPTARGAMDAWWTSYFNGWLDYQGLHDQNKRWVTAFTPRLMSSHTTLGKVDQLYPDGRYISVIREPTSWYASAREWSEEWEIMNAAVHYYRESAEGVLYWKQQLGDRLLVLSFDDLVTRTADVAQLIARFLRIRPEGSLSDPTFNHLPIKANSSFSVKRETVIADPLTRGRDKLSDKDRGAITAQLGDAYEAVLAVVTRPPKRREPAEGRVLGPKAAARRAAAEKGRTPKDADRAVKPSTKAEGGAGKAAKGDAAKTKAAGAKKAGPKDPPAHGKRERPKPGRVPKAKRKADSADGPDG